MADETLFDSRTPVQAGLCECGCGQPTGIAKKTVSRFGIKKGHPRRFCHGHFWRTPEARESKRDVMLRFRASTRITPTCGHPDRPHYAKGLCHSCYVSKWLREHPDSNSGNGWHRRNPEKSREKTRRAGLKKYGLTLEGFIQMWESQGGKCANPRCSNTFPKSEMNRKVGGLHVDHCHKTGKVRGLLCPRCNTALGHTDDDTERLLGLIEYLRSR